MEILSRNRAFIAAGGVFSHNLSLVGNLANAASCWPTPVSNLSNLPKFYVQPSEMKLTTRIAGWAIALLVQALRFSCRLRLHDDPRPALRAAGKRYVYAVLHAHQLATMVGHEPGLVAMVSRSADGDLIVPVLKSLGITPVRGSSRRRGRDKGGRQALDQMIALVAEGKPAYIAVDGPNGPRNRVRKGIAQLSISGGAVVIPTAAIPSRRWIWRRAWDRLQVPKPFSRIDGYFGQPLAPLENESVEQFRRRIEASLNALEAEHDPAEATRAPAGG